MIDVSAGEGHKAYTKSMFGSQIKSTLKSSPKYGFGTSNRDKLSKQYVSKDHAKSMGGNYSQGAIYKTYPSIGNQPVSYRPTSAKCHFGTSTRNDYRRCSTPGPGTYRSKTTFGSQQESKYTSAAKPIFGTSNRDGNKKMFVDVELSKVKYGMESPPPNIYKLQSSIGKQAVSCKTSSPMWCMGTAHRFKKSDNNSTTSKYNANFYNLPGSVGCQISSEKQSSPSFGFGTGTRDKLKKVYVSSEHEKQNHGECSPGPVTAKNLNSFGKQALSYNKSSPGWVFGTSNRDEKERRYVPGPGAYCI